MRISASHNMTPQELTKALARLADDSGIGPEVAGQLLKACACDDEPKEPNTPAVAGLFRQFQARYQEAMTDLREIVSQGRALRKSVPVLTTGQIRDVLQTIRDRFDFMAGQMQQDYQPDEATLQRWKDMGLVPPETTPLNFSEVVAGPDAYLIRNAFIFGRLWRAVEAGTSYAEVLRAAQELPLLRPDLDAIAVAEQQAAIGIQNFAGDLATEIGRQWAARQADTIRQMTVDFHDRTLTRQVMDREAKEELGIQTLDLPVTNWQQLASELYHTMEDKARDWQRVAFYEITDSQKQGRAQELLREVGPDGWVYKRPLPTACAQCVHAYLQEDGSPRLFRLRQLVANGSNIGRKPLPTKGGKVRSDSRDDGQPHVLPVAGLMHPWCSCTGPYDITGHEHWITEENRKQMAEEPLRRSHVDAHERHYASGASGTVRAYDDRRTRHNPNAPVHEYQIPPEVAKKMGATTIRLNAGKQIADHKGFGLEHIRQQHGPEIRSAGYPDEEAFVADVVANFNVIYALDGGRIALVYEGQDGRQKIHVVECRKDERGSFYTVVTGYIAERRKFDPKRNRVLWRKLVKAIFEGLLLRRRQ